MDTRQTRRDRRMVSVIIPVRNAEGCIAHLVRAITAQQSETTAVEVIVSDDGSSDGTVSAGKRAGARVVSVEPGSGGNPAAARNRGAAAARGDPLIFVDADCVPTPGWLTALLAAHDGGADIVGGALDLPPGLPLSARCDYYSGWYHVHSRRPAADVISHPPGNVSVRRAVFTSTTGFDATPSVAYAHEELAWQAEARRAGHTLAFEPSAIVHHHNRPGIRNLLRRNYRWGYGALESKSQTGAARLSGLYRYPWLLIAAAGPIAILTAFYTVGCWLRARRLEPLLLFPLILLACIAWSMGMTVGGVRWMARDGDPTAAVRPLWE